MATGLFDERSKCSIDYAASGFRIFSTEAFTRSWMGPNASFATFTPISPSLVPCSTQESNASFANSDCSSTKSR